MTNVLTYDSGPSSSRSQSSNCNHTQKKRTTISNSSNTDTGQECCIKRVNELMICNYRLYYLCTLTVWEWPGSRGRRPAEAGGQQRQEASRGRRRQTAAVGGQQQEPDQQLQSHTKK